MTHEQIRALVERLREAVTVLDEPFHREAVAHTLLEAADALASPAPLGDAGLRERIIGMERWDDVQCFPDDPSAPPYAEMRRDPDGRWLSRRDVLALLDAPPTAAQARPTREQDALAALNWLLHLAHGCGRSGEGVGDGEIEAACEEAERVLALYATPAAAEGKQP